MILIVYYIYHKDNKLPKPTGQLVKAFLLGILSIPYLTTNVIPVSSDIALIALLVFCLNMWKNGSKSIQEHLKRDLI
jgi:RsiW-degrading membrane proteinase PrsW (M82 family)